MVASTIVGSVIKFFTCTQSKFSSLIMIICILYEYYIVWNTYDKKQQQEIHVRIVSVAVSECNSHYRGIYDFEHCNHVCNTPVTCIIDLIVYQWFNIFCYTKVVNENSLLYIAVAPPPL